MRSNHVKQDVVVRPWFSGEAATLVEKNILGRGLVVSFHICLSGLD